MSTTQTTDLEAIQRVVTDAQRLQSDADGFAGLLTEDAVLVNFGGRRVLGRRAIHGAMTQALATPLADVITTQEIDDIRFVRPDVALVSCTKHIHDGRDPAIVAGQPPFRDRGALLFVLVRSDGAWRIASAQTTPVAV